MGRSESNKKNLRNKRMERRGDQEKKANGK